MKEGRLRRRAILALALALLGAITALVLVGIRIPELWTTEVWAGGFVNGKVTLPPFPAMSNAEVYSLRHSQVLVPHYYLLGSDSGGRDLMALTARAALQSFELVIPALVARMVLGIGAGWLIAAGTEPLRTVARAASGWIAGFPYLALAVLVIQAFTGGPSTAAVPGRTRLIGFVVAIAVVGWRDIAELVASRIQWVSAQEFALGARAIGSTGFGFFRRHTWPYLRPALAVELSFQAGAVLVLLAELGFLQYYLGGFRQLFEDGQRGGAQASFQLALQPELGQMVSNVRLHLLRQELAPAYVPVVALALAALAFELLGRALRGRTDLRT